MRFKHLLQTSFMMFLAGNLAAQTYYLSEDFESGFPSGWSQTTLATDGGWLHGTAATLSSQYWPLPTHTQFLATNDDGCNCTKTADILNSDIIDLTGATTALLSMDLLHVRYQASTLTIRVSTNAGSTWTSLGTMPNTGNAWVENVLVDVSAYTGTSDFMVQWQYNDAGGWEYGAGLDNVAVYTPMQYDINHLGLDMSPYGLINQPVSITGLVRNHGAANVTSFDVNYSVSGGSTVTGTVNTNLGLLDNGNYTHPTQWTPTAPGTYVITAWTSNVNGNQDGDTSNDTVTATIEIFEPGLPRTVLLESFTSSTCAPCKPGNENVDGILASYSKGTDYVNVRYQMSWPGNGDPYFTDEGNTRRNFYGVSGIPDIYTDGLNGMNSNSYTSDALNTAMIPPAYMSIDVEEAKYTGSIREFTVGLKVKAIEDFSGNNRVFIALIENTTYNNVETNLETEFYNVMKKMVPNASGIALGTLNTGDSIIFNETFTIDCEAEYRLPGDATDPIDNDTEYSIEEFDDLAVVVWVQNMTTKQVHQATMASVVFPDTTHIAGNTYTSNGKVIHLVNGLYYEETVVNGDTVYVTTGCEEGETLHLIEGDYYEQVIIGTDTFYTSGGETYIFVNGTLYQEISIGGQTVYTNGTDTFLLINGTLFQENIIDGDTIYTDGVDTLVLNNGTLFQKTTIDGQTVYINGTDTFIIVNGEWQALGIKNFSIVNEVRVYPNPTAGLLNISFKTSGETDVTLSIHDVTGRVVKSESSISAYGKNILTIDVSELASGTYQVSLRGNDGYTVQQKFVKQ